jgi:hypothetical protein
VYCRITSYIESPTPSLILDTLGGEKNAEDVGLDPRGCLSPSPHRKKLISVEKLKEFPSGQPACVSDVRAHDLLLIAPFPDDEPVLLERPQDP